MRWPIGKRDDDRSTKKDCSWFVAIEKHAVLTEVRGFGDPHLDKTRCLQIIKKLLYLLNQGETFTKSEAVAILSSAVNLYRFQDVHLRRMFHLIARDLCPIADKVPLVTSSLLKEVNTDNVADRANAIRLLCHITNETSLSQVVKFLDEALRDDNPILQSASLVCAINLIRRDPRMAITLGQVYPESTVSDKGKHVQFHAIYLEFVMGQVRRERCINMKATDIYKRYIKRHYVSGRYISEIDTFGHSCWSSSPLGPCILARGITKDARPWFFLYFDGYPYTLSCIHDKDEMVAIEGFRSLARVASICIPGLNDVTPLTLTELKAAIDVMRILCVSHRPVVRFSAFRALQKVGVVHNEVWTTPEDHIAIGLDVNVYNLYNHRDNEPEAEQESQVIKSPSYFSCEHDLDLIDNLQGLHEGETMIWE
ncbi:hypothetical protein SASPL_153667 [Salvia splendens]|uniref:Clathrin/coatomer adaptor adaptin-like N-terminal domain-containing protein n=1 Tax=Salvia splendens TaxID=180675 RepID=A0A8X8VYR8_SALSN|nr:coatomer subunit gamma-like isoform X2 [Salvia splendens]KAG6384848.1 hypothetical protein SASPL_153667 [Salvia splendens]